MAGAPRSQIDGSLEAGVDRPSSDHWYNVLRSTPPGTTQGDGAHGSVLESAGALDGPVDPAGLQETVRRLEEQNGRLVERLDVLARAQDRHETRRDGLETKIDRLCAMFAADRPGERKPLDDAICQRITESMKPFFLAIIDLLELSMRHTPASAGPPSVSRQSPAERSLSHADKPPGGLPPILTRPLDELIEAGHNRARSSASGDQSRRGSAPTAAGAPAAPQGSSTFPWTPVIPETSKR